jgi:large repetitive protein
MHHKSLLFAAVLTTIAGPLLLSPSSASASPPAPTISSFSPTQGPVGTAVVIEGTNLADATGVTFGKTAATIVVDTSTEIEVRVPTGATTSYIKVTTAAGIARSGSKFVVLAPLNGVVSLAGAGESDCALLTSGGSTAGDTAMVAKSGTADSTEL